MTAYYIWLAGCLGRGAAAAYNLLREYQNPRACYQALAHNPASWNTFSPEQRKRLDAFTLDDAHRVMESCAKKGIDILTIDNVSYPERLKNIYAPPVVLYSRGKLPDFERLIAVAIVGSRRTSDYGAAAATRLGYDLAAAGAVVVSGMALGIDARAHRGALDAGGITAAVLGCGADIAYPPENESLMLDIEQNGVILTEYPPGEKPVGKHFPARNRIIAGLCNGVVVVEAPQKSGALITATLALEQGRDIFAVPGSIFSEAGEGTLRLLRDGAIPVGSAYDILIEYEGMYADKLMLNRVPRRYYDIAPKKIEAASAARQKPAAPAPQLPTARPSPRKEALPEHLSRQAAAVYQALEKNRRHVDEIAQRTGLTMPEVLAALTELELEELAHAHPGRQYSA